MGVLVGVSRHLKGVAEAEARLADACLAGGEDWGGPRPGGDVVAGGAEACELLTPADQHRAGHSIPRHRPGCTTAQVTVTVAVGLAEEPPASWIVSFGLKAPAFAYLCVPITSKPPVAFAFTVPALEAPSPQAIVAE